VFLRERLYEKRKFANFSKYHLLDVVVYACDPSYSAENAEEEGF
jgi:hypothetical protein